MMRYTKEGNGELFMNAIGSISKITEERYDDHTMLANYGNIESTMKTPQEILAALETLQKEFQDVAGEEGLYLRGMVKAFHTFTRVLDGEDLPFTECIRDMQQVELRPIPQERFEKFSYIVSEKLGARGYTGTVGEQVQAYLKDTALKKEEVTTAAMRLLDKAKQATLERVINLPKEDLIEGVYGIENVFWGGYSRYIGDFHGDLTFNLDKPWSVPTFFNVLCHEGYPGHQTFYCHWDQIYREGRLPLEAAFYSTAGNPANCMFEGSPECALHFLGWDDFDEETPEITDQEKADFALGREIQDLTGLYQQQASYLLNVEKESREAVVKYILNSGLSNETSANGNADFFGHPVQKYYYPAYYYGRWMIYEAYERIPKQMRRKFFDFLYETPLTNETFIRGIEKMTGSPFDPFKNC